MKTGLQIISDVWKLVNVTSVTSKINGKVVQFNASVNSKLVNVVIGLQGADNKWMQQATVNVNIHAPNRSGLKADDGTTVDSTQPDLTLFGTITALVLPLLDKIDRDTFNIVLENTGELFQDTDGTWFMNIKVDYQSIQTNFKNI